MTASESAAWDRALVAGHVLAAVKEALASATNLGGAAVVAVRQDGRDVLGRGRVVPVLAVRFRRDDLRAVRWETTPAWTVVDEIGRDTVVRLRGSAQSLTALDLRTQPDLRALVDAIDLADLRH